MIWLYIKALHIIAMVTWFAGLFYLPRLFVYHAMASDAPSIARFKIMERKLYFGIATPGALFTLLLGALLYAHNVNYYAHAAWMNVKLIAVAACIIFHLMCGYYGWLFKQDRNTHTHVFYRYFNEVPTVLLFLIIIMIVVQPNF